MQPIKIPRKVEYILGRLQLAGFEAFVVGGCVRDSLLGLEPKDWDITTSARPEETKRLFPKTIDTGIKHGTVTAVFEGEPFEITTYRVDGLYADNRRPDEVFFTRFLEEDLARRDFSINAMAYNTQVGLADYFEGVPDLKAKLIRTVGNADDRFSEDALRMLRAVRFSAQLGFRLEEETFKSVSRNSRLIERISSERVREELTKTLISANVEGFGLLHETGLLKYIIPEFEACYHTLQNNPYHVYNVAGHSIKAIANIDRDPVLRWTMLLHDVGKAVTRTTDTRGIDHFYGHPAESSLLARKVLKRLRMDNKSTDLICRLIYHHDRQINDTGKSVRKAIKALGKDIFLLLLKVQEADKKAQNPIMLQERLDKLDRVRSIYRAMEENGECTSLKELAVNGRDLAGLGFREGKEIGLMLDRLLEKVLEKPELNKKDILLAMAFDESKKMKK